MQISTSFGHIPSKRHWLLVSVYCLTQVKFGLSLLTECHKGNEASITQHIRDCFCHTSTTATHL